MVLVLEHFINFTLVKKEFAANGVVTLPFLLTKIKQFKTTFNKVNTFNTVLKLLKN